MYKKVTKYAVIILAILVAELINAFLLMILQKYKSESAPYYSTLLSMCVAVMVFYPLLTWLSKPLKKGAQKYVKEAQKVTNDKHWGLTLGLASAFLLLFMAFAKIWYDRNMLKDIKDWFLDLL